MGVGHGWKMVSKTGSTSGVVCFGAPQGNHRPLPSQYGYQTGYTSATVADHFDLGILGGGSGGYVAAIRAAQLGMSVVLVESDKVGGVCLHRGCIPTKVLLQTAFLVDALAGAHRFGLDVQQNGLDYGVTQVRKAAVVSQLHRGIEFLLKKNKVTFVAGRGRLGGEKQLLVETGGGQSEYQVGSVILATGSRPRSLPGLPMDGKRVITSDEALEMAKVPDSAIVLGAGAVGVEFASLWRSLGAEVTLVEMAPSLVPLEDADIGAELAKRFMARGITCHTSAKLDSGSVQLSDHGVQVSITGELSAEVLLCAIGRSANVEELGLEAHGIRTERGMVLVDSRMETSAKGIYAVGDMVGGFQLAHKAMHEGVIAAEAIAGLSPYPLEGRHVPRTTYCSPQIGSLGLSEQEAIDQGYTVSCGVMPFRANGRALIWGEPDGFCKVVADSSNDEVLGVHMIGHEVTELIAGPALGALLEASPFELVHAVAPHPTLSEVLGEAALAVSGKAIHI